MTEENGERLSGVEIGKDAVQSTIEAAASTAGEVATIISRAVHEIAGAIGGFATEVFEIRDAARAAADDRQKASDQAIPAIEEQLDDDD